MTKQFILISKQYAVFHTRDNLAKVIGIIL